MAGQRQRGDPTQCRLMAGDKHTAFTVRPAGGGKKAFCSGVQAEIRMLFEGQGQRRQGLAGT